MQQLHNESVSIIKELSNLEEEYRQIREKITSFVNRVEIKNRDKNSQLVTQQERMLNVLECITDCFFSLDNQWNFTYINKATEKMLEINREDFLEKNFWEVTKDNPFTFVEKYREAMTSKKTLSFKGFSTRVQI